MPCTSANDDVITSTTPHPDCVDNSNWVDEFGDGCEYLEAHDEYGCPNFGCIVGTDGIIRAFQACCWCGGGEIMASTVSTSPSPSPAPTPTVVVPSVMPSVVSVSPSSIPIPSKTTATDPIISTTTTTTTQPSHNTLTNGIMPVASSATGGSSLCLCLQDYSYLSSSCSSIGILLVSASWMLFVSSSYYW